jgi:hypothetical protein
MLELRKDAILHFKSHFQEDFESPKKKKKFLDQIFIFAGDVSSPTDQQGLRLGWASETTEESETDAPPTIFFSTKKRDRRREETG